MKRRALLLLVLWSVAIDCQTATLDNLESRKLVAERRMVQTELQLRDCQSEKDAAIWDLKEANRRLDVMRMRFVLNGPAT